MIVAICSSVYFESLGFVGGKNLFLNAVLCLRVVSKIVIMQLSDIFRQYKT